MRIRYWSSDVCSSDLAADMAANGGVAPGFAKGAGNVVPIEVGCDGLGALSGGELAEDAADDGGLGFIDLPLATHLLAIAVETLDYVVAVAEPATRLSFLDAAAQTAMGDRKSTRLNSSH